MAGDEYSQVQKPFLEQLQGLGYHYTDPADLEKERDAERQVLLVPRLRAAIRRLNPDLSEEEVEDALRQAVQRLTSPAHPELVEANASVYEALVQGVQIQPPGQHTKTVKLIDFQDPSRNDFLATDSVPERSSFWVQGEDRVAPDILVFVNGIPLVVVECKSPHLGGKDPILEAQDQLQRYLEKAPRLFYPSLMVLATCAQDLRFGPIWNPSRDHPALSPWYDDSKVQELTTVLGRTPNPQELFLASLFTREAILDYLRYFVAFAREKERMVKKIARSQQVRAVNAAVGSAANALENGGNRGGTIWHWQGSGKSLTMVWLAAKLRDRFQNPAILLVTDRIDLDRQLDGVFRQHNYPNPHRAESIADLKTLLTPPTGKTVLTTIQKLGAQEAGLPVLSEERQMFALCDEAHRSQYRVQAARMRELLPNAVFFAFTGTPLEKEDRHTPAIFGEYIDRYTIRDAERDGTVVPIHYEHRGVKLEMEPGMDLDQMLLAYFQDAGRDEESPEPKVVPAEALRRLRARLSRQVVARLEARMEAIARDLIKHYLTRIERNGFKAMVVAHRRAMALRYKEMIDAILRESGREDIQTEVVITWQPNDPQWMRQRRPREDENQLRERFKDSGDPLKIICVSDKLLTGFDAPVLQVMYLDKVLREHNLLQAIARTNRPLPGKEYGLAVDYYGIAEELKKALARYEPSDVEGAYRDLEQAFTALQGAQAETVALLGNVLPEAAPGKRLDSETENRCVELLATEDLRKSFAMRMRVFAHYLNLTLPDPRALPFAEVFRVLAGIQHSAYLRYRDRALDPRQYVAKLQQLVGEAVKVVGLDISEPAPLLSEAFERYVGQLPSNTARIRALVAGIEEKIDAQASEDPTFYRSIQEDLKKILEDFRQRSAEAKALAQRLLDLRSRIAGRAQEAEQLGLSTEALAFYHLFQPEAGRDGAIALAQELVSVIQSKVTRDWVEIPERVGEVRTAIARLLRDKGLQGEQRRKFTDECLELAKRHFAR